MHAPARHDSLFLPWQVISPPGRKGCLRHSGPPTRPARPSGFALALARERPTPSPTPPRSPTPGTPPPPALALWREKLEFLQAEEATIIDPDQKFRLRKLIEEARAKIREHGGEP